MIRTTTFALTCVCTALLGPAMGRTEAPLAGMIWGVHEGDFVSIQEMMAEIRSRQFILVGERHGREAHQGREAFLIGALAESGRYPTLALEMLTQDQQRIVYAYRARSPEYSMALGAELAWGDTNWPSWSYYNGVFDAAFAAKLKIVGADLDDDEQKRAAGRSVEPPTSDRLSYYRRQMQRAHCNLISDDRARELAELQVARDAQMSAVARDSTDPDHGSVLIAGASHVRKSTGIPSHLPEAQTAIILLLETDAGVDEFKSDMALTIGDSPDEFDFIWLTPKVEEVSICDRIQ